MPLHRPSHARLAALVAVAALALPAAAEAQVCLGNASFAAGRTRFDADLTLSDGATTIAPGLAFGGRTGAFGGVAVGITSYDGADDSAVGVSGNLGYQIPVGEGTRSAPSRVQLCPRLGVGFTSLPGDATGTSLDAGATIGTPVALSPTVDLVPFGGLALAWRRVSVDDFSSSETGGILSLGTGLVFSRRYTARVGFGVPLGFDGSDTAVTLGFGINFGQPGR